MNFSQMHERLRLEMLRRIQRGTVSVSLLARQTGYGQAHLSNFLHDRRQLSLEAMDRILAGQHMTASDLLPAPAENEDPGTHEAGNSVPIVPQQTALYEPQVRPSTVQSLLFLPHGALQPLRARASNTRRAWQRFVAVRIAASEAAPMDPLILPEAVVLIDRHYNSLLQYRPQRPNLYAVRLQARLVLRYVEFASSRLVLRPHNLNHPVELIEVDAGEPPNEMLVGRVVLVVNEY